MENANEQKVSLHFHQVSSSIPFLVSPRILRRRLMGQVDMARVTTLAKDRWRLEVTEVKGSREPGKKQWGRLMASADFLGKVFDLPAKLTVKKKEESLSLF